MLRFLSAGESNGKILTGILEGAPAGFSISSIDINRNNTRRIERKFSCFCSDVRISGKIWLG